MIRKWTTDRHSNLYCPFCGAFVADCLTPIREDGSQIMKDDVIECDNCGYEAYATLFPFKPSKTIGYGKKEG